VVAAVVEMGVGVEVVRAVVEVDKATAVVGLLVVVGEGVG
jgi:hypothetical protein